MSNHPSPAGKRNALKSAVILLVIAVVTALSSGMLRGSMPDVQTGSWVATGNLAGPRAGASAVLMPSGGVLLTGGADGSGSVDTVEWFGADGALSASASMNEARADHTAVLLKDGRVLVVGGRNASGPVGGAEVFAEGGWSRAGGLADARWGQTATLLKDGRVLVAGGENASGAVMSLELFDPETGVFSVAGTMAGPRKGHAAARLSDGRVIIAGGGTDEAALASTEIFNPETLQLAAGPSLNMGRFGLTATTLMDGRVVFIGGHNGTSNLASAEIYSDVTNAITYTATSTPMVPRRGHQAFLLPNNNAVLIVGGIAEEVIDGAVVEQQTSAAELYLPWLGEVWQTGGMTAARSQASGAVLSAESYGAAPAGDGLAMVAGGAGQSSSEAYRFATIRTDQNDYAPGEKVHVSGGGWLPDEEIVLSLRELPAEHATRTFTVKADGAGHVVNVFLFDVEVHHLGVRFFLTARGAASQAQVSFTDGNFRFLSNGPVLSNVSWQLYSNAACASPLSGAGTSGIGTITATDGSGTTLQVAVQASQFIGLTAPATVGSQTFQSWAATSGGPSFTTSGSGLRTICVAGDNTSGLRRLTANYVSPTTRSTQTALALSLGTNPSVYGAPLTLTASVTAADGNPNSVGTVTFKNAATIICDTVPLIGNTATCSPSLSTGTYSLTAEYSGLSSSSPQYTAGSPQFSASTSSPALSHVVNPAPLTVTADPKTKGYGAADPALTYAITSGALVAADTITGGLARVSGENVGTYAIQQGTLSAGSNYSLTYVSANLTITARSITVAADAKSKSYGDSDPPLTFQITAGSLDLEDEFSGELTRAAGEDAGTYAIQQGTLSAGPNYAIDFVSAIFTIDKASSTTVVSCGAGPFTYNGTAQTPCAVAVTGAGGLSLTPEPEYANNVSAGTATASYTYAGDANHTGSNDSETFTIAKAAVTATAGGGSATYDGLAKSPAACAVSGAYTGDLTCANSPASVGPAAGTTAIAPVVSGSGQGNFDITPVNGSYTIEKASSTTVVTCGAGPFTYNGTAQTPCSATVTGAGGLNESLTVHYADNVNAGTATASASYAESANHLESSDSTTFTIGKANATLVVNGYTGMYDGAAHGATGTAKGIGGVNLAGLSLGDSFTNVPGGTAHWTFADVTGNYNDASGTVPIVIDKANATLAVTGYTGIYDGNAHGATGTATGVNGENLSSLLNLGASFTNVPGGSANWGFAGNVNYNPASGSVAILIGKAPSTTVVTCPTIPLIYTGAPFEVCTAAVTGVGGLTLPLNVTYVNNVVGLATASAEYAGDNNHTGSSGANTFQIWFGWTGFLQPINDTAHQTGVTQSRFKLGQTVPAKFVITDAFGAVVQQAGSPYFTRSGKIRECDAATTTETAPSVSPDVDPAYKWTDGQYHYNWSTKGINAPGVYRIYANLADGTNRWVDICLTK